MVTRDLLERTRRRLEADLAVAVEEDLAAPGTVDYLSARLAEVRAQLGALDRATVARATARDDSPATKSDDAGTGPRDGPRDRRGGPREG